MEGDGLRDWDLRALGVGDGELHRVLGARDRVLPRHRQDDRVGLGIPHRGERVVRRGSDVPEGVLRGSDRQRAGGHLRLGFGGWGLEFEVWG